MIDMSLSVKDILGAEVIKLDCYDEKEHEMSDMSLKLKDGRTVKISMTMWETLFIREE